MVEANRPAEKHAIGGKSRESSVTLPRFDRERDLIGRGFPHVAGVDELGRGPLAGPVAAAAVILDPRDLPDGVDDSKALSEARREALYEVILARAMAVGIGFASPREIDRHNIRQATFLAMARAVAALAVRPHHLLVDGNDLPTTLGLPGEAIVGGDALCVSIAAASVVAKVTRDRLMVHLDRAWPHYGFARHKGYATAAHRAALARHGPSPAHRASFAPCRAEPPDRADAVC